MPHDAAIATDSSTNSPRSGGSLETPGLIEELEAAVTRKDTRRQAEVMRRITNLFVIGVATWSPEHLAVFDDIMVRFAAAIETAARAKFGDRLATLADAPPRTLRSLALDDAISVAGPILSRSACLDEGTLLESARTKSQEHLLAISRRRSIGETVTDVLVQRGNRKVAVTVAGNDGARFSDFGAANLVARSKNDGELALRVWSRSDIPRPHLLSLFSGVSEAVRRQLEAADPSKAEVYSSMVDEVANRFQAKVREGSARYEEALALVEALHKADKLDEAQLLSFAQTGLFDEVTIALSLMCDLPVSQIERAIVDDDTTQFFVLARAVDLSWQTTRAILLMPGVSRSGARIDVEALGASFAILQTKTARAAIQFHRLRARAVGVGPSNEC